MRNNKFRAWIKQEILGGFMIPSPNSDYFMVSNGDNFTIYDDYKNTLSEDNYIIMEYTGLNDDKGIEIYEGDLIKGFIKEIPFYEVFFEDGSFRLRYKLNDEYVDWGYLDKGLNKIREYGKVKIISNIYKKNIK